jgi:MFS family permease
VTSERTDSTPAESAEAPPSNRTLYAIYVAGLTTNALSSTLKLAVALWCIQLGMSASMIGIAIGAGGFLPFFLSIHGGVLMDRFGTRRVNTVFSISGVICCVLYPILPYASAVIALQLVAGLTLNMGWMGAQALIVQFAPGDTTAIGRFTVWSRIGNLIGPAATGFIWDFAGAYVTFAFVTAFAIIAMISIFMVPRTKQDILAAEQETRIADLIPRFSDYVAAFALCAIPAVAFIVANTFLRIASSGIQGSFYVVYLESINISGGVIGILLAVGESFGMFGAGIAGWMEKKLTPHWTLLLFHTLSLVFVCITPWLGGIMWLLVLSAALRGNAQGLAQPVMFAILSRAVSPEEQGRSIGMRTTVNRLASMGVPPVMGLIVDAAGLENSFAILGGVLLAFAIGTGIVLARSPGFKT